MAFVVTCGEVVVPEFRLITFAQKEVGPCMDHSRLGGRGAFDVLDAAGDPACIGVKITAKLGDQTVARGEESRATLSDKAGVFADGGVGFVGAVGDGQPAANIKEGDGVCAVGGGVESVFDKAVDPVDAFEEQVDRAALRADVQVDSVKPGIAAVGLDDGLAFLAKGDAKFGVAGGNACRGDGACSYLGVEA